MNETFTWLGILLCLSQSASLSGLNLAVFRLSRLRLEIAAKDGNANANRVLALRTDANFTLATILWGNVAVNVLLTLLAESVLAGVAAFLFSTVVITFVGEIIPQAYFSRHALRVAGALAPLLRFYQILLWPVARPVGKLLDVWVGPEGIPWFQEKELRELLLRHGQEEPRTEVSRVEAIGAINFLALDDIEVQSEGETVDPRSLLTLPVRRGKPALPAFHRSPDDPFLKELAASDKKWAVVVDSSEEPQLVFDTQRFLREALFGLPGSDLTALFHRPLVVRDPRLPLGQLLGRLQAASGKQGGDVIDLDLILLWTGDQRKIITGSDILGRLLRRIARRPA